MDPTCLHCNLLPGVVSFSSYCSLFSTSILHSINASTPPCNQATA